DRPEESGNLDEEEFHGGHLRRLPPGARPDCALRLPSSRTLLAMAVDDAFEHAVQSARPSLPAVFPANHLPGSIAQAPTQHRVLEEPDEPFRERRDVAVPYQDARLL